MNNTNQQPQSANSLNIESLLQTHEPLLRRLIRPYRHLHMDNDLLQEARLAVLQAIHTYPDNSTVDFTTHALPYIYRALKAAVRLYGFPVALPPHPRPQDMQPALSLQQIVRNTDDDPITLADTIAANSAQDEQNEEETQHRVEQLLSGLTSQQRQVVCYYYGIGFPQLTMSEIAQTLGIMEWNAYKILWRAEQKIYTMGTVPVV